MKKIKFTKIIKKINLKVLGERVQQIITFLVILFASLLFLTTFKTSEKFRLLVVNSGSMRPAIKEGSLLFILSQKEYKKDDIITFSSKNQFVTHRIIEIKKEEESSKFITKGDANNTPDDKALTKEEILGKLVLQIPLIGYIITFTKTLPGLIFLIVIPATIIVYQEFLNLKKEAFKFLRRKKLLKTLILIGFTLLSTKATLSLYSISASSRNNTFTAGFWVIEPSSTPTPPQPTLEPTPTATITVTPTSQPELTPTPTLEITPLPSLEPEPTTVSTPTVSPEATETPPPITPTPTP